MKKKLLFIIPSLCSGGAEKSLITLLELIDYSRFEVDLFVFRREGLFCDLIPEQVNVFDAGADYKAFDGSFSAAMSKFIREGKLSLAFVRMKYMLSLKFGSESKRVGRVWDCLKRALQLPDKEYDAAIGYLEGTATCLCVEKAIAKIKIGYVHSDYIKLGCDADFDRPFLENLSTIVTVSERCAESLVKTFPEFSGKIKVVHNIVSQTVISHMAECESVYSDGFEGTRLLTIGRMSPPKGIDLAVDICAELKKRRNNIRWYHIGRGELEGEIREQISRLSLEDDFVLLGEKVNPYPYIYDCDIYVQPSKYEGKSIAVDEVKCLAKPIVVTCFSTVFDQIQDGVNGLIAQMSDVSVADKIEMLIGDAPLRKKLSENLRSEKVGNEEEIEKFYELLG